GWNAGRKWDIAKDHVAGSERDHYRCQIARYAVPGRSVALRFLLFSSTKACAPYKAISRENTFPDKSRSLSRHRTADRFFLIGRPSLDVCTVQPPSLAARTQHIGCHLVCTIRLEGRTFISD